MAGIALEMKVGEWQLEYTRVAHLMGEHEVSVRIGSIELIFAFTTDEGTSRFIGKVDGAKLRLTMFNQNSPFGVGQFEPLEFMTQDGVAYGFTYFTQLVDKDLKARSFEISIYRKVGGA